MSMPDDAVFTAHAGSRRSCRTCRTPTPAQAHCAVCHRTFGGVTGFDAHRVGGHCVDPTTKGYSEINGIWRVPMDRTDMPKWKGASAS